MLRIGTTQFGLSTGGRGIGVVSDYNMLAYSNPVITTALTIAANAGASVMFNADGPEVIGSELQINPNLTGTGGTNVGSGTMIGQAATSWEIWQNGTSTSTVSKDANDAQIIAASGTGTTQLTDIANPVSFVAGNTYKMEVKVTEIVGTCTASVASSSSTNIQVASFTLLNGLNRVFFKAAYTAVGTINVLVPTGGSIVISKMSVVPYTSPRNYLRAIVNTGSGLCKMDKVVDWVVTSLISATVPVQNKNYAPTGCCTDPDWDLNATTEWIVGAAADILTSVSNGSGGYCLRVTEGGTANPLGKPQITVKPMETYRLKVSAKAGTEATCIIQCVDRTNGYTVFYNSGPIEASSSFTEIVNTNVVIPAGCVSINIYHIQICSAGAGTYIDFDNVSFTKTSTDDLTIVVDKAAAGTSSSVSLFHDGVQVGTSQTITDAAILNGKYHYLSGDYGASVMRKRRFALGPELVVNGGFDADANWSKGTGWDIGVTYMGKASSDGSQTAISNLVQLDKLPVNNPGHVFKTAYTVSNYSTDTITINLGGVTNGELVNSNKESISYLMPVIIAAANKHIYLLARSNFVGSVDNVSVKEVLLP